MWGPAAPAGGRWRALARSERVTLLAYVGGFVLVSLLALWLNPDPRGLGTHEQLGLPPCTTQALFHIPCPFCGMTTAFSLMVRGQPISAFQCQPAGAMGYAGGVVAALAGLWFAAAGRYPTFLAKLGRSRVAWAVGIAVIVVAWIYKLVQYV
jgi:hypothetical protein